VVQGDTTTAMVTSLVAFYNKINVLHVEAGLRTYNKLSPFPEEVNRQLIGRIADVHFAPTSLAQQVLEKEGITNVHLVGNTVIDSLFLCLDKVETNKEFYESKFSRIIGFKKLVLITGHRRENFGQGFDDICIAIRQLSVKYPDILFYYPVHLNPNVKDKVHNMLNDLPNVYLDTPLPYDELVYLMSRSYLILTDSGGIQEEAPSLNVPVLVMRDTTERPEGIQAGCSKLVGTDKSAIVTAFTELVENRNSYLQMTQALNPYGDGNSAKRIADIMMSSC
jgi:UDP-N-acetylglucosamine 2-epimerase (non-hydrolysing)